MVNKGEGVGGGILPQLGGMREPHGSLKHYLDLRYLLGTFMLAYTGRVDFGPHVARVEQTNLVMFMMVQL